MAVEHAGPIFGRAHEIAELASVIGIGDEQEPSSRSVLLGGDAGIGKTRLVADVVARAHDVGRRVLVGHCLDLGESAQPFQPFVEALSTLDVDEREVLVTGSPVLAALLSASGSATGVERSDVLAAVTWALDVLAEQCPLLLVVEDAHWADASTRHLLQLVLARRFHHPVSLVVSYRTDDLHRRHPLRGAVAEWIRLPGVRRLELAPLEDGAVGALLRWREGSRLDTDGVRAIVRRAAGNAFYAEELLDAGLADGSLPESLADLLLVRVDRLDEAARRVVGAVACGGGRVVDTILLEVTGLDADALDAALREAIDHKVLVLHDGSYRFRHALLAEAVREDLLPGQRRRLHSAFLAVYTRPETAGTAREIALHAEGAGDLATAFTANVRSGEDAVRIGGHDEAAGHFRRALALVGAAPQGTDVVGLVVSTADALLASGRLRRARQVIGEHLEDFPASDAIGRGRLLVASGNAAYYLDDDDDAEASSAEALSVVPDEPTVLRAEAEALRARALVGVSRDDEAIDHAERALATAETLDEPETVADAQATLTLLLARAGGDTDKTRRRYTELIASSRAAGDVHGELRGLHLLAFVHYNAGEVDEAERQFRTAMERAAASGRDWAPYGIDGRVFAAVVSYIRGRWDDVTALRDVDVRVPAPMRTMLDAVGLLVTAGRGREPAPAEIERLRAAWPRDFPLTLHSGTAMIDLYGHHGDVDAAVAVHDDLVEALGTLWRSDLSPARLRMAGLLVGQLAGVAPERSVRQNAEAVDRAVALVAEVDPIAERTPGLGPEGRAWHQRIHAEVARLRWLAGLDTVPRAEMEGLWRATVESFAEIEDVYEQARSRVRLAAVLGAAGQGDEAIEHLARAREVARGLGAEPLLAEIASALPRSPVADLTPREREVLTLVSAGRTNGEIASQLFISTKTASVHVSNILAKLDAVSRTEAAAIARRRDLL